MTLATQAEYARRLGVTRAAISQWKLSGRLVLDGAKIDVEKSDQMLKKYRAGGLPEIVAPTECVKHRRKSVKPASTLNTEPVLLKCADVLRRLVAMDYTQTFDWSDEAMAKRVELASQCIGWSAFLSDIRDDGHWGGYQLRIGTDGIAAGYGYELSAAEVLFECRDEIAPIDTDDEITVRLDLLHHLARPFYAGDIPR